MSFLFPRAAGRIEWSLDPVRALLRTIGNPERHFQTIHVGGTNGKGSVAAMVYASLRAAGHRAALYTSPHLVDARERVIVDDRPISATAFAMWTERLRPEIDARGASFFEALTAIAFADFAARGADVAVVEVGMGGRLDSTNVVDPLVSAVVSVDADHAEYLGESLVDIAREKAGIAKAHTPFVIGEPDASLAGELGSHARRSGATPVVVPSTAEYPDAVGLQGRHQRRNAAVAERVLLELPAPWKPSPAAIRRGIANAHLPGRFDRRGKWLFDVAHNLGATIALAETMRDGRLSEPVHALVGILGDKDWRRMLEVLQTVAAHIWLVTAPTTPVDRRWDVRAVKAAFPAAVALDQFDETLHAVQEQASTILVTGSFYTVGYAMSRLPGFAPLG